MTMDTLRKQIQDKDKQLKYAKQRLTEENEIVKMQ